MDVLLAPSNLASDMPAWVMLGVAVMAVVYVTMRPKKRDPLSASPFRSSLAQQKSLERDMQNVIVELSEMTRQMSAQLETRAARLEALIHEADEKMRALQALHDSIDTAGSIDQRPSTSKIGTHPPTLRLAQDDNPHTEDRWAEVYRLNDQGLALPQIAQSLGRPMGEIELILALRPRNAPDTTEIVNTRALASGL